jgi:hypothetical protein
MALDQKTLAQLHELKIKLQEQIRGNPRHSRMEQVELDDVNSWIQLRLKESHSVPPDGKVT